MMRAEHNRQEDSLLPGIEEDEDGPKSSRSSRRVSAAADKHAADELPADDVAAEEVDFVVARIKRMVRQAGLEFALSVGSIIIHHFYGGNMCAWRSRGPKTASFRRLAAHPDVPLSPVALYRCVALLELCERLNAPTRWSNLGASHLRAVLALPANVQENLLATANAERWTVRALQEEVLVRKSLGPARGGRRAQPHIARCLTSLKRSVENYQHALGRTEGISTAEAEHGLRLLEEAKAGLEALQSELRARVALQLQAGASAKAE